MEGIGPETDAEALQAVGGAETPLIPRAAGTITKSLVAHVGSIVASCGSRALLVYADAIDEDGLSLLEGADCEVFCVTKTPQQDDKGARFIRVPDVSLSRLGQVKIAVFMALTKGLVSRGDLVVCLSGFAASGTLDTLVVTEIGSEFEMLAPLESGEEPSSDSGAEVIERILELATALGNEGREEKHVGAIFVVGDASRVLSMSRPLILNPFRGHPEEERNIMDIREIAKKGDASRFRKAERGKFTVVKQHLASTGSGAGHRTSQNHRPIRRIDTRSNAGYKRVVLWGRRCTFAPTRAALVLRPPHRE